jgi:hypothetical protein
MSQAGDGNVYPFRSGRHAADAADWADMPRLNAPFDVRVPHVSGVDPAPFWDSRVQLKLPHVSGEQVTDRSE